MAENHQPERFPILDTERRVRIARKLSALALRVSELSDTFSSIERIPRYASGRRENDVEHSFMLAITAPEMVKLLGLELDIEKIRTFALVHDLLEVKVGDVATFDLTEAQLSEKERIEQVALQELLAELPELTAKALEEYERQDSSEAIFVRMVDKLLPIAVDVTGEGVRVLVEDYGITSYDELMKSHNALHARIAEKFGNDFPDLVAAHAQLCKIFEQKYIESQGHQVQHEKTRSTSEIERKYLVDLTKLPEDIDLNKVRSSHLMQGYIAIGADGSETRVRSFDNERYELTIKTPGMIERGEQTIKITREMFEGLWLQTVGRRVTKTRYYIPYDDLIIELDIYEDHLEGLVTAEVEFDGRPTEAMVRANTFESPAWFGKDVSSDPRYKNHSLATHLPVDPTPLGVKAY
jgi:adenylate cyclase